MKDSASSIAESECGSSLVMCKARNSIFFLHWSGGATGLAIIVSLSLILFSTVPQVRAQAGPSNGIYTLQEYGFGAGGTENSSNGTYGLQGIIGEVAADPAGNGTTTVGSGLIFTNMANVPPAPSFTNPGNHYDRLQFIVNTGSNPADTEYAIEIRSSADAYATARYIQDDGTVGSTLGPEDWQTYADWGGAAGEFVTGLSQDTTYRIRVKANQGNFTESGWGPDATAATVLPTLTFGVSANSVVFSNLNAENSYTDSSKNTVLTTSTNAYNGYIIYGRVTQPLTFGSYTIANYASGNASPTLWSGTGFGYTTSDSSLTGGTADRFTSGGPRYAGFSTSSPGDPVADNAGPILTPVIDEEFTVSYRVTTNANQVAGDYRSTIVYIVVPTF
ncbi:MAG: hypothetical protein N2691_05635 [Patescibacteria group bacterium]|nr:hypothetical protein [Patescibacteria group bacterium]